MSHQSELEPSNFTTLFESALEEYAIQTGKPWAEHPLAQKLEQCHSLESVSDVLQERAQAFTRTRGDSKIAKSLKSAISVLYMLSSNTALRDAISVPFPPATPIFIGFAVLLNALKDISASHDALADLLELIEQSLNRLEIYTKVTLERAMVELIVKMMVQLLHVLGLVIKEIKRKPLIKIGKKLSGDSVIEVALQKLNQLNVIEGLTATAQILGHTDGLVQDGKAMRELLQQMTSDINESRRDKLAQDIRNWLSPPDPWENQNQMNELRHSGTAAWFLNGEKFTKWNSSEQSSLLWIHGIPGAGKSVLCSAIIQDINDMRKSRPAALMFFYCDFKHEQKRDLRGLLSSLLVQLCYQSDLYYDLISKVFSEHRNGSQHASDAALVRCLKDIMTSPRRHPVYLIMDALDECPNPVEQPPRKKVLDFLAELINSNIPNLHICVTSRPEADIIDVLHSLTSHSISLHDEGRHSDDINNYIKSVVDDDRRMRRWKLQDKQHVIDVLTENANGMFRWVNCQVDYLRNCHLSRIRKVLAEVPKTLDETYARVLREIKESHQEFAQRIFQCVAVASRPLRVKELAEVLAFDFEAGAIPEFREDWREDDPVYAVLSACSSLLAVIDVEDTQVIQFSHFSVKEFLTSERFPQGGDTISDYHISMTPAHTLVARVCLGTLLHLPEDVTNDSLETFPLAEYAAENWVDHARFEDVSHDVEDGMKQLFDPRKAHLPVWVWIHDPEVPSWRRTKRDEIRSGLRGTALHYAALCGLHSIVKWLITEHSQDVQALGFDKNSTPLHLASSRGHVELARVLLERGAVATAQDGDGSTPLHCASSGGHVELAWVLLEHGAVATAQAGDGWTPLHGASSGGHVKIARLLLAHSAVATAQDEDGSTPLHWASSGGHIELARLLLEHGALATAQDRDGTTPLHEASSWGRVELARVLLEHGAVTTVQDRAGWTPLWWASSGGHVELKRVLLQHGSIVTAQDR